MKKLLGTLAIAASLISSCAPGNHSSYYGNEPDPPITQSLFSDKSSTISEENIQKILEGTYKLPQQLRLAMVRLEPTPQLKRYYWNYWSDEQYLKTQQSY